MRIAETPRRVLRRFRIDDAAAFYALNVDPEVIGHHPDAAHRVALGERKAQDVADPRAGRGGRRRR